MKHEVAPHEAMDNEVIHWFVCGGVTLKKVIIIKDNEKAKKLMFQKFGPKGQIQTKTEAVNTPQNNKANLLYLLFIL